MEYSELLKDPRWQKKRLEIFNRDNWTCQECDSTKNELHIHHKKYIQGIKPWEYENSLLITKCKKCHTNSHTIKSTYSKEHRDGVRRRLYKKYKKEMNLPPYEELWIKSKKDKKC